MKCKKKIWSNLEKTLAGAWSATFTVDCQLCILVMILIIPYVEYPAPSVYIIKDGNTELPEHVLRNHSQKFFWEGNKFAEVLALNMNIMDRGAVCVRQHTVLSENRSHMDNLLCSSVNL
jgi:hypothetical protein